MYTLYTTHPDREPSVWIDPQNGQVLKFTFQEDAHRYAERVDNKIYLNYELLTDIGLYVQGVDYRSPPKYIIKKI